MFNSKLSIIRVSVLWRASGIKVQITARVSAKRKTACVVTNGMSLVRIQTPYGLALKLDFLVMP